MTERLPSGSEVGFGAIARPRTFINVVLDKSDSMEPIRKPTVDAFNDFLSSQKYDRVDELFVTLTTFSDAEQIEAHYQSLPIERVPALDLRHYRTDGSTALYDAIAKACADTDKAVGKGDRVIICIVTDGGENASQRVRSLEQLLAIKARYEERRNWTFTFLAAGVAAHKAALDLQITPGNLRNYTADPAGVSNAMTVVSQNLSQYRRTDDLQTDTFFNPPRHHPKPNWASTPVVLTDQE